MLELALSAAALGVAAFDLRLVMVLWTAPLAWELPAGIGMVTMLTTTAFAAATPLVLFAVHIHQYRRLPRTFLVPDLRLQWWYEGRAFVVPPTPWLAMFPMAYLVLAAGGVTTEQVYSGELTVSASALLSAYVLLQPVGAVVLWFTLRGPQVALTQRGLLVRSLFSGPDGRLVRWDELDVSRLAVPDRRTRELRIPMRGRGEPVVLPLTWLWINPIFLAGTIRQYAMNAEHRAAIGNASELERIHRLLTNNHSVGGDPARSAGRHTSGRGRSTSGRGRSTGYGGGRGAATGYGGDRYSGGGYADDHRSGTGYPDGGYSAGGYRDDRSSAGGYRDDGYTDGGYRDGRYGDGPPGAGYHQGR